MKPYAIEDDFDKVLVNGLALRAYVVHCPTNADAETVSVLVYAQSETMACVIGCGSLSGNPVECEATEAPQHNARAVTFLAGREETDAEYLRDAGWRMEGESICSVCGLYPFGLEEFGVCSASGNCKACGCDDDDEEGPCDHADGFSVG